MTRQTLRIGGVTIAVESEDAFAIPDPVARFLVSPEAVPDVSLVVKPGTPAAPDGDLVFDSGGVWRLHRQDDGYVFSFRSPVRQPDPFKMISFDPELTRGEIVGSGDPLEYPLDELLVGLVLSTRGEGVELHGVGIVDEGRGYLFIGQSGAGKTTTARLWMAERPSAAILSDDRIIVRETNGELRMYGTPWHGEAQICAAADAPLAGIYLLEQSTTSEVREIEDAEAVARLFACSFPLFYQAEALAFTIAFLERIVAEGKVHVLAFARDASAVRAVTQ